ncbi:TOL [Fusarium albosuccineum]|uniref:TOL n=1 Tax=Fusarium albosuccineum TaxID=1237068 RepID=A0A8H4KUW2_9HYPO|nr:TOL [Fusarium albosuccineum]
MNESVGASLPVRKRVCGGKRDIRCTACALLFSKQGLEELNSPDGFQHRTRDQAEASIREGCTMCEHLVAIASEKFGKAWKQDDRLIFRNVRPPSRQRGTGIDVLQGSIKSASEVMTICPFVKQGDPAAALIPRRPLRRDVKSDLVFTAARKLIRACLGDKPSEGHKHCRYSRDTVLPTRVLDVGDSDDPDSLIRLQVNDVETRGSYLALSYCWGKPKPKAEPQPLLLRTNSLLGLRSEIRLSKLDQSIQDAIFATHSATDKDHELKSMATIYKNASVTLAAGTAVNASDGFLDSVPRKPATYLPEDKFSIPMEDDQVGTVYLSAEPYEPDHPLDKRGWTLQEYMLSSRMLIFSDYELLWQCKEVELQSVTGNSKGLEYQQPLESLPWTVFDEEAEPFYGADDWDKFYLWQTIVRQYTERELRFPEDRLRAIMGVSTELEVLWRDTLIYGHWKRWFIPLLAWYKPEVAKVKRRHLTRAPSWSWASVDGEVHYEGRLEVQDAKINTLTVADVVLSCRMLQEDDIDEDKAASAIERPDFATKAVTREIGDKDCQYLLLGRTKEDENMEKGVGLLVLQMDNNRYRRIGLVVFMDMSIWEGVPYRNVRLEPKAQRK